MGGYSGILIYPSRANSNVQLVQNFEGALCEPGAANAAAVTGRKYNKVLKIRQKEHLKFHYVLLR